MRTKVIVADDHSLFRKGLIRVINQFRGIHVIGEAVNGQEALSMTLEMEPDVLLLDLQMPILDGYDVLKKIKEIGTGTKIIIVSMFDDASVIYSAIKLGACGFLSKTIDPHELELCIANVMSFGYYFNDSANKALMTGLVKKAPTFLGPAFDTSKGVIFTEREKQILRFLREDLTSKEIAEKLFLSNRTIEGIRHHLIQKVDAKSVTGLLIYALRHKIIDL